MGHPLDISRKVNHRDIERRVTQQDRPGKSGGATCELSYDLRIFWNPQAGTVEVGVTYNSVFETFDIAYNATAAEVGDELSSHSELVAASKTISVITAGDLPSSNMIIVVPAGATLSRGSNTLVRRAASPTPEYRLDTCCAS